MNKIKIYGVIDWVMAVSLCFLIFFLPFAKAGIEIFTWLAVFLWILKRAIGYRADAMYGMFPATFLNKALAVLFIVKFLSVIFSCDYALSWRGLFGKELKYMLLFFVIVEALNRRRRLIAVLIAIVLSVLLIIVDSCVQHFHGIDFLRHNVLIRLRASFATANAFAAWLVIMIPLFLGLAGWLKNRILKFSFIFLALILTVCLVLSFSRGGWIGFVFAMSLAAVFIFKNAKLKIKMAALFFSFCLFAGFFCMPPATLFEIKSAVKSFCRVDFSCYGGGSLMDRLVSFGDTEEIGVVNRLSLWSEALHLIENDPLFGCGLNTYVTAVKQYKGLEAEVAYSHNSYLQMAAETGIPGFMVFLWFLFRFFKEGLRWIGQKKDFLVLGLMTGLLAFLIHAFFDNHFYSLQLAALFWYMLGLTTAAMKLGLDD